ncbi:MAG: cache domain-containing protein, partial [Anaerolineaceae bacterium]
MNIFKLTTHLHHNTAEPGAENRLSQPTNAPFLHVLMRMITLRLYLPATVLTVLIIALSGYFYARLIEREQIQVAKSVAARVDDYLLNADRSLESIAAAIDLEPPSKIDQVLRSEHTIQPFFTSLYLLDENEILAASIPQSTIPAGLGNQDLSRLIRDVSKSGFSEPYISSETGKRAVLASRTLTDGRRILGELDLAYLDQMILEYQPLLPGGQLVFISDDKGTLMTDSSSEFSSWQATFSSIHARANNTTQPISRLSLNRPIPVFETQTGLKKANWIVTAELPLRNAITPYLWIIWISLATLLVLWLILVFTINHYGVKQLTAPLEQLSQSVRDLAESEGAIHPALASTAAPISEIRDLATNFEKIFAVSQQRQIAAME